jgi:hypothetical protein
VTADRSEAVLQQAMHGKAAVDTRKTVNTADAAAAKRRLLSQSCSAKQYCKKKKKKKISSNAKTTKQCGNPRGRCSSWDLHEAADAGVYLGRTVRQRRSALQQRSHHSQIFFFSQI